MAVLRGLLGMYRDLILGDDALLYIAYVMLIWAPISQLLGLAEV